MKKGLLFLFTTLASPSMACEEGHVEVLVYSLSGNTGYQCFEQDKQLPVTPPDCQGAFLSLAKNEYLCPEPMVSAPPPSCDGQLIEFIGGKFICRLN